MLGRTTWHYPALSWNASAYTKECNITDKTGQLPLHRAAQYAALQPIEVCLSINPESVNAVDNAMRTPLCLAAWNGSVKTLDCLIEKGARIHHIDRWGPDATDSGRPKW